MCLAESGARAARDLASSGLGRIAGLPNNIALRRQPGYRVNAGRRELCRGGEHPAPAVAAAEKNGNIKEAKIEE